MLITKHPKRKVIIGMDANARVAGLHDSCFIGPTVPPAELTAREWERGGLLLEFLAKHDFYLANTWANESIVELMVTRVAWDQMCDVCSTGRFHSGFIFAAPRGFRGRWPHRVLHRLFRSPRRVRRACCPAGAV